MRQYHFGAIKQTLYVNDEGYFSDPRPEVLSEELFPASLSSREKKSPTYHESIDFR